MKRFTETTKWSDPWFRKLSPAAKLLWIWLTDTCDAAGVIEPDVDLATFQIGMPMGMNTFTELGERVEKLECGKLHIVKFVEFQVGTPSLDCKAHNPIFQSWDKHKIKRVSKGYPKGIDTVQEKDKEKDKDKSGEEMQEEGAKLSKAEIADWTERIIAAYPRRDSPADCKHALFWVLETNKEQTPAEILEQVQECAYWISIIEGDGVSGFVPKARKFFGERQWTEPKNFEGQAMEAQKKRNGAKPVHKGFTSL